MKLQIIQNPDKEEYDVISRAVIDNNLYCPCMIEQSEKTKCICEEFRNQQTEGFCKCNRYKKVFID